MSKRPVLKKLQILITLLFFTVSCATPTVVNVIGPTDNEFSLKTVSSEIVKANKYANESQEDTQEDQ